MVSAEQSFLIKDDERLVKQQDRGRHHKPKMLIPNPVIYLRLHRVRRGESHVRWLMTSWKSWQEGSGRKKRARTPACAMKLPTLHTQRGHLLNKTVMKEVKARTGCGMSVRGLFHRRLASGLVSVKLSSRFSAGDMTRCKTRRETHGEWEEPYGIPLSFELAAKAGNSQSQVGF